MVRSLAISSSLSGWSAVDASLELIRRLPKTDLHLHLDGSLRLDTVIELARERNLDLPSFDREQAKLLACSVNRSHPFSTWENSSSTGVDLPKIETATLTRLFS